MLEVLYASGIRRSEPFNLTLDSIDGERGVLTVREGNGDKDPVVPILPRAIAGVERDAADMRPTPQPESEHVLLLTVQGRSIAPNRLTMSVREYIRAADTGTSGSCHAFRHSLAMGTIDNGADIRCVQAEEQGRQRVLDAELGALQRRRRSGQCSAGGYGTRHRPHGEHRLEHRTQRRRRRWEVRHGRRFEFGDEPARRTWARGVVALGSLVGQPGRGCRPCRTATSLELETFLAAEYGGCWCRWRPTSST